MVGNNARQKALWRSTFISKRSSKCPDALGARSSHVVSFRSVRSLGSPPSALPLTEIRANRVVDNCSILDVVLNDDNVYPAVRKERNEYRTTLSPGGCLSIAMLVLIPSRSFHRASTAAGPHYHSHLRSLSSHWHKLLGAERDDDRNLYGLYTLVGEERSGLPSVFSRLLISFFSAPLAPLAPQARTLFSVLLSSSTTTTRKTH